MIDGNMDALNAHEARETRRELDWEWAQEEAEARIYEWRKLYSRCSLRVGIDNPWQHADRILKACHELGFERVEFYLHGRGDEKIIGEKQIMDWWILSRDARAFAEAAIETNFDDELDNLTETIYNEVAR